jgi:hypothetical protein
LGYGAEGKISMVAEVVVGYLARWALERGRPVGRRVNREIDQSLASLMDRLHGVVASRLGGHPALTRLEEDIRSGGDGSTAFAWATHEVDQALRRDQTLNREVRELVARLQDLEGRAGQTAGRDAVSVGDRARSAVVGSQTVASGRGRAVTGSGQIGHRFGAFGAVAVVLIGAVVFLYYLHTQRGVSPAVAAYQKRVLAVCSQIHNIVSADHSGDILVIDPSRAEPGNVASIARIRKSALLHVMKANVAGVQAAFNQLGQTAPPPELTAKKRAADGAYRQWLHSQNATLATVNNNVTDGMTLAQFQTLDLPLSNGGGTTDVSGTAFNGAMSDLAGQECSAVQN